MEYAITAEGLSKLYARDRGCKGIEMRVAKGCIFGLLGPNGAGKSTFVKMLLGLVHPTAGSATVLGKPIGDPSTRARIGFLPEIFRYQEWLSGRELLNYHLALDNVKKSKRGNKISSALEIVGLSGAGDAKIRTYSKGMQQRLGIASALVADPDLVFLDEPTSALDPMGRFEVREILLDLKNRGKTVFLNSHLLSEVEMVCDEVAILNNGSLVTKGRIGDLLGGTFEVSLRASTVSENVLTAIEERGLLVDYDADRANFEIADEESIADIAKLVMESGARLYELSHTRRSLEDLFMEAVKEKV